MTIYWMKIGHEMAEEDLNDHGPSSRRLKGDSSKRPLKSRQSLAGRSERPWQRTRVSAFASFKFGFKIKGRKWRSYRGKRKQNLDRIKSLRKKEGRKVLIATIVSSFVHLNYNFFIFPRPGICRKKISHENFSSTWSSHTTNVLCNDFITISFFNFFLYIYNTSTQWFYTKNVSHIEIFYANV